MYIWLDFISKTGHVTYYYIPTNFSQKLSPKKGTKISYIDIPQTCYIVYGCPQSLNGTIPSSHSYKIQNFHFMYQRSKQLGLL